MIGLLTELLSGAILIILVTVLLIPPINLIFFMFLVTAGGEFVRTLLNLPDTEKNASDSQGLISMFLMMVIFGSIILLLRLQLSIPEPKIYFVVIMFLVLSICGFVFLLFSLVHSKITLHTEY